VTIKDYSRAIEENRADPKNPTKSKEGSKIESSLSLKIEEEEEHKLLKNT